LKWERRCCFVSALKSCIRFVSARLIKNQKHIACACLEQVVIRTQECGQRYDENNQNNANGGRRWVVHEVTNASGPLFLRQLVSGDSVGGSSARKWKLSNVTRNVCHGREVGSRPQVSALASMCQYDEIRISAGLMADTVVRYDERGPRRH